MLYTDVRASGLSWIGLAAAMWGGGEGVAHVMDRCCRLHTVQPTSFNAAQDWSLQSMYRTVWRARADRILPPLCTTQPTTHP